MLEDHASGAEEGESTDEGRAILQTVHDVAPDASLAFATAFGGEEAFAKNIERLAQPIGAGGAGANVITDDVAYFEEPFFQDGPVAGAINRVVATGVEYFTAAGNDNLFDATGHEIASWEASQFRDSGSCPPALEAVAEAGSPKDCMKFGHEAAENTFGITVERGATLTVDLQWAEPWFGVHSDLDAFLLNSAGEPINEGKEVVGSYNDNVKTQKPAEVFQWKNKAKSPQTVELAINHCFGKPCNEESSPSLMPRLKVALLENGGGVSETQYPTSSEADTVGPTIVGHSGDASAITVGAERYDENSAPEPYSSRGPITHYFDPVSNTTPAPALPGPRNDLQARPRSHRLRRHNLLRLLRRRRLALLRDLGRRSPRRRCRGPDAAVGPIAHGCPGPRRVVRFRSARGEFRTECRRRRAGRWLRCRSARGAAADGHDHQAPTVDRPNSQSGDRIHLEPAGRLLLLT